MGGIGALALLLLFIGGIAANVAKGNHPDCYCLGQLHAEPAGWATLVRNAVLALVAAYVVGFGRDTFSFSNEDAGYSAFAWVGHLSTWELIATIVGILAIVAIAIEGWLLFHLVSQQRRVLLRLDAMESKRVESAETAQPASGLLLGAPAPAFSLSGLHGETLTLDALRAAGRPVLLVFSDPGCGPCTALLPDIGRWQREHSGRLTLALVSRGKPVANRAKAAEHGVTHVLLQDDREVAQAYQAHGTPAAVVVRPDGTIGSPLAAGAEAIRTLVAESIGTLAPEPPLAWPSDNGAPAPPPGIGDPAPGVSLPDLTGKNINLADFRGHQTLVLFWDPGCGYCQRALEELKAWETDPPPGAPRLLVVSTGSIEANRAQGLRSPVVLDEGFAIGRAFGASGTPNGVLVDADGRVASQVAVGAPAALALAGRIRTGTVATATPDCERCLDDCRGRGGGDACVSLCTIGGRCS